MTSLHLKNSIRNKISHDYPTKIFTREKKSFRIFVNLQR
jgi:hypothetical protein